VLTNKEALELNLQYTLFSRETSHWIKRNAQRVFDLYFHVYLCLFAYFIAFVVALPVLYSHLSQSLDVFYYSGVLVFGVVVLLLIENKIREAWRVSKQLKAARHLLRTHLLSATFELMNSWTPINASEKIVKEALVVLQRNTSFSV
jgi:hypothetical protein